MNQKFRYIIIFFIFSSFLIGCDGCKEKTPKIVYVEKDCSEWEEKYNYLSQNQEQLSLYCSNIENKYMQSLSYTTISNEIHYLNCDETSKATKNMILVAIGSFFLELLFIIIGFLLSVIKKDQSKWIILAIISSIALLVSIAFIVTLALSGLPIKDMFYVFFNFFKII